jgi:PAS domain S-box-containing protein/putative nucleotidyltransferase with HDIG domain
MKPHFFNEESLQWRLKDSETITDGNEHFFRFFQIDSKTKLDDIQQMFKQQQFDEIITYNEQVFLTRTANIKQHTFIYDNKEIKLLVHRHPFFNEQGEILEVICDAYHNINPSLCEQICNIEDKQFKDIVEAVSDLIAITDQYGAFQYLSPQWQSLLGYEVFELIGKSRKDIMDPEDAEGMLKAFAPYYQKQLPFSMLESDLVTKNGRKVSLDSSGTPIFNQEGHFVGYHVISRDITIRKRIQDKSLQLNKQLERLLTNKDRDIFNRNEAINLFVSYQEVINQISRKIINAPFDELKTSINESLRLIGGLSGVDRVYIFSFHDNQQKISNTYEWNSDEVEPAIDDLQNLDAEIFPWWMEQLRKDQVINIYDVNKMSKQQINEKKILQMQNIKSVLVVPLYVERELIGFLGFDSVVEYKKWDVEIQLLRMLAEVFAFSIRRQESEAKIIASLDRVKSLFLETIEALSSIVEHSDPYTAGHQNKVAKLAKAIATKMGMGPEIVQTVYIAGILHDLGKIFVPTQILNKPSKISALEFELIKTHPEAGAKIVRKINFPWPIADIILQHHERLDGSGYPNGLKGDEILMETRILMVADNFDAIISHRFT